MTRAKTKPGNYVKERVRAGRRVEFIAALLLLSMVTLSLRSSGFSVLGIISSVLCLALAFYNFLVANDRYIRLRAKYIVGFVALAIFGYYASFSIASGDITLIRSLTGSLITATSISAVFAVTIYEKVKELTLRHRGRMTQELLDISVRLATYPILVSVVAVFASILALIFSGSNFIFSIFLVNITITFVLLALIMSVELLKEDLMRELGYS